MSECQQEHFYCYYISTLSFHHSQGGNFMKLPQGETSTKLQNFVTNFKCFPQEIVLHIEDWEFWLSFYL